MCETDILGLDRDMGKIRLARPLQLRVEIREVAALQQRIIGEIHPRHDVGGAERHLLGLGEEVVHHPVQHQPPDDADRHLFLGDQLGRVQNVEFEPVGEGIVQQLQAELPFREVSALNRRPHVAAVEVGIGAVDLHRLVPAHQLHAEFRLPVEFDISAFAGGIDQVGKLDRVLDEEHRDVVADDVPVSLLRVELHSEAADVSRKIGRALVAGHRRDAHERRCAFADAQRILLVRDRNALLGGHHRDVAAGDLMRLAA